MPIAGPVDEGATGQLPAIEVLHGAAHVGFDGLALLLIHLAEGGHEEQRHGTRSDLLRAVMRIIIEEVQPATEVWRGDASHLHPGKHGTHCGVDERPCLSRVQYACHGVEEGRVGVTHIDLDGLLRGVPVACGRHRDAPDARLGASAELEVDDAVAR